MRWIASGAAMDPLNTEAVGIAENEQIGFQEKIEKMWKFVLCWCEVQ
jgi:hypothetical protein